MGVSMAAFVGVGWLEQLPPGRAMTVTVGDINIALFNVDGTVHAIDDACLHAGASLGAGVLDGKVVRCRGHGWKYDVTTGQVLDVPGLGVTSRAVKVVDGRIMVAMD
jgi:nitrite reductase/ring-hydroxylating ferredoxin subunit